MENETCRYCAKQYLAGSGVTVTKHTNRGKFDIEFCCENCANEYYLKQLRRAGL